MTTAIFSAATLQGTFTALEGVREFMENIFNTQIEIADSIIPPGYDESSLEGTAQQKMRIEEFARSFNLGMVELQRYIQELQNVVQQMHIVDTEGAGNIMLASPDGL